MASSLLGSVVLGVVLVVVLVVLVVLDGLLVLELAAASLAGSAALLASEELGAVVVLGAGAGAAGAGVVLELELEEAGVDF